MSDWKPKRFWKTAATVRSGDGFSVELDGRPLRTPAKALLKVPTRAMADTIATEWAAQDKIVDPGTMPATRSANAAIDKVSVQHREVADMIADYGDADLLCYRAEHPEDLVARQAALWDPVLDWAAEALGARMVPLVGVMHRAQSPDALDALRKRVHDLDPFRLAAFHDLVTLTGSLILGFAAAEGWRSSEEIWKLSRLDEIWQVELWGHDEEAAEAAELKRAAFLHAKRFYDLSE